MNMTTSSRFVRAAGWIGVLGVAGFCLGIAIAGLAFPGYSHVDQMISELGGVEATHAWVQNLNFVLFGACVLTLAAPRKAVPARAATRYLPPQPGTAAKPVPKPAP